MFYNLVRGTQETRYRFHWKKEEHWIFSRYQHDLHLNYFRFLVRWNLDVKKLSVLTQDSPWGRFNLWFAHLHTYTTIHVLIYVWFLNSYMTTMNYRNQISMNKITQWELKPCVRSFCYIIGFMKSIFSVQIY